MAKIYTIVLALVLTFAGYAQDNINVAGATNYTFDQCQGSLMPYPAPSNIIAVPDSLTPLMINHVGRHGARYPASAKHYKTMLVALMRADSAKTITPLGRELMVLVKQVMALSDARWGALDSLGMAEQRGIASRMYRTYPRLMMDCKVHALSSYSPRCMMSMYSFTHQLDRLCNRMDFYTSTGRMNDALMRPFDIDEDYIDWRKTLAESGVYEDYFKEVCPVECLEKVLGRNFTYKNLDEAQDLAITEYYCLAGLQAMSLPNVMSKYFTREQANALWSCFNLRQYLQRTASVLSSLPADIAGVLLADIIHTTDEFLAGESPVAVQLRFGHAETLMPLLSLMHVPGCFYLTNYYDTVAQHWRDFEVVPMAANLQMIVFADEKGKPCVRFDLNERPVELPGLGLYPSWERAREYLMRCLPLEQQF
ncbi:MAG: histidine phosphatase family protein [Bacteroidales bacterium]|nr:histidine phosphatase family protein [Bacteroidales bacterium]